MQSEFKFHVLISIAAALLFLPLIGSFDLFDWDELNFAESAREMLVSGNFAKVQIGFEPFWEKPPLFIWMQALCMKLFGVNEFAARLPNAIAGIITLNFLYFIGRKIRNHFMGMFWVLAYAGSIAPFLYFRSGIIDPVFNLFILCALYQLFLSEKASQNSENPRGPLMLAAVFTGLAILTKGPVAVLILITVYGIRLFSNRKFVWHGWLNSLLAITACIAIAGLWFIPEWIHSGSWFLKEFIHYQTTLFKGQIEWHNQPWYYHIVVLLFLCFPASIFALPYLVRNSEYAGTDKVWSSYMRSMFWVVLVIFSLSTTKIIHYSSICWFPISWFAGSALYRNYTNRGKIHWAIYVVSILVAFALAAVMAGIPALLSNTSFEQFVSSKVTDPHFRQYIAAAKPHWSGFEIIIPIAFILAVLILMLRKGKNPTHLFLSTLALSFLLGIVYLPRAAKSLQGDYTSALKKLQHSNSYVESWGFKTYAVYFYTQAKPEIVRGKWDSIQADFKEFPNPGYYARSYFLHNKPMDKEIYIFTRVQFKPDVYFLEKFKLEKTLGPYLMWKRKDKTASDPRL
jgi:4-amino-4-deoxy-L-arabinose transferase-like glycosyltransferase